MTRPVRIAVQIQPQHAPDYGRIRDAVRRAEDAGVDIVFTWDHFFPLFGDPGGAHFECWTMLAAFAEQTERVEIGALVSSAGYRNPDLLADMARTVDHISGGRLILGVGSGWFERDYDEYGYEFGTAGSRLKLLAEYLPRVKDRLGKLIPPPNRHIPVLIGGGGEKKTLPLVAQYADIWHSFCDIEAYSRKAGILADRCADNGRNPESIAHSTMWPGMDDAATYVDAGVTLFTVHVGGPEFDLTELKRAIAWRDENTPPPLSGLA